MIIKKAAELYFTQNDMYILETSNNEIIVNDNYEGILVLDNSFEIQRRIIIPQEAPIYFVYQEYKNSGYVLYFPDDHRIVFIDLKSSAQYITILPQSFNEEILLSNYYWNNDILIFTTTHNDFYQLNFISKTLDKILPDKVQDLCIDFFDFWSVCKEYNILTVYPFQKSFIFQNNNQDVCFFNYKNNQEIMIGHAAEGWHDVQYQSGTSLFIYENKIDLLYDKHKNILIPRAGFIFLKVKFLDDNKFVVLSSNPSNTQESILEVYNLSSL